MRPTNFPIAKEFEALAKELDAAGLEQFYYPSEMWFYPQGLAELRRRAELPERVDDATPEEIKFGEVFFKHFPK